jgi:hypothetical protein
MTGVTLCTEIGDLYESRLTVRERSGRKESVIWSIFEIGGTRGVGVAAARSSAFGVRHSEQIQQGCARPRARRLVGRLGGGRLAREQGDRRQGRADGNRCQPSPQGACPWWPCSSAAR